MSFIVVSRMVETELIYRGQDARWGELIKSSEEHSYAQEQLENRNDVRSRSVPPSPSMCI